MKKQQTSQRKQAAPKKRIAVFDQVLLWLFGVVALAFVAVILLLNMLPIQFLLVIVLGVLIGFLILFLLFLGKRGARVLGRILTLFMATLLGFVSVYGFQTQQSLSDIAGATVRISDMSVVVLLNDAATDIQGAKDYSFGAQIATDAETVNTVVGKIESEVGQMITTRDYAVADTLVNALYSGEVEAILLNEASRSFIEETHPAFSTETKVIASYSAEVEVEIEQTVEDIATEPFTVYISGIDVRGSISTTSRCDVNILATINPNTHQVLLTTTPRDYYVELPYADYALDKLTHTGVHGVDASMETLEHLYGIDIDYYARVNFTGMEDIVDAMGGITVYSEFTFSAADEFGTYYYTEGENQLNGAEALMFSRERASFTDGDLQRGRNQMAVIEGMINKLLSPAIITNYSSLLASVSDSMETSMSNQEITDLVRSQIDSPASWDILSQEVTGSFDSRSTYSMSQLLSVIIPDEESVATASAAIQHILDGGVGMPPLPTVAEEATDDDTTEGDSAE